MSGVDGWVGRWVRGWGGWRPPTALLIPDSLLDPSDTGAVKDARYGASALIIFMLSRRAEKGTRSAPGPNPRTRVLFELRDPPDREWHIGALQFLQ